MVTLKIAIIADTHFGVRNDQQAFHDYFDRFYREVFFPKLKEQQITTVLHLGDVFDRRKFIQFHSLYQSSHYFFHKLEQEGINVHTIIGNHDIAYRNTLLINSPDLLLRHKYSNITIYDEATPLKLGGMSFLFLPWICAENREESIEAIENSTAQVLLGHLEVNGFEMTRGLVCDHGLDSKIFDKFEFVFSGHFHHKSTKGNIHYLGSPYEMKWGDFDDPRGFHIFDTETKTLEFVRNPYRMFYRITYDDSKLSLMDVMKRDYSMYRGTFVRLVVHHRQSPVVFEKLLDRLESVNPLRVQVVDEQIAQDLSSVDEALSKEVMDTPTLIKAYVNDVDTQLDKKKLDSLFRKLYDEAISLDIGNE